MSTSSSSERPLQSAILLYKKRDEAESGLDQLDRNVEYVIEEIPTEPVYVPINGPLVGWCIRMYKEPEARHRLWDCLKTFFSNPEYAIDPELQSLGIPRDELLRHRASLNPDKHLLVVHGPQDFVQRTLTLLQPTEAAATALYTVEPDTLTAAW